MKRMKIVTSIAVGWPNANGRIYTQEAIAGMSEAIELKEVFLYKNGVLNAATLSAPVLADVCGVVKKVGTNKGLLEAEVEVFDQSVEHLLNNKLATVAPMGKGTVKPNGVIMGYQLDAFSLIMADPKADLLDDDVEIICQTLQELLPDFCFAPRSNSRIFVEPMYDKIDRNLWLLLDNKANLVLSEGTTYRLEVQKFDLHSPNALSELVNKLRTYLKDTA